MGKETDAGCGSVAAPVERPVRPHGCACDFRTYMVGDGCAAICDAIEDQAWARWRVDADPTDQGRSTGAAQCAGEIRRLR